MKRVLLISILVCAGGLVRAQYIPNNGQTFQFASAINPAFSGVESFGDLKMSYRYQWSGFGGNAPRYLNLAYTTRLKHPLNLERNAMRISRPALVLPENLPKRKRIIHGFGVNVHHSKVGVINSTGGAVGYAWNYPLSRRMRFSVGVSGMVESRQTRLDNLTFNEPDPFYNYLLGSASSQVDLNLRAGMLLYSKGFYLGLSYLSVAHKVLEASELALDEPFYRGSVQTGFAIRTSPAVAFKPSLLAYLLVDNSVVIDYSVKAFLHDKGWAGLTYRDSGTGILMLGLDVSPALNVAYSYEVGFGGFQPFGGSSHEVVMGLRINNLKKEGGWVW